MTEPNYPLTMQTVRDTIIARGELTEEQIDSFLTRDDDEEAQDAYERYIAPAIDRIEDDALAALKQEPAR